MTKTNKYLEIRKKRLREQGIKWLELDKIGRIEVNPQILCGKPVIRGTRIAVEHVLEWIAGGMFGKEIIKNYPNITEKDIQACLCAIPKTQGDCFISFKNKYF